MTFGEFKKALESATLGDKKVPSDENLIPLANMALLQVASLAKPFSLTTKDRKYEPLLFLEDGYFIRKPERITNGDTIFIDIDENLSMAVVYATAMLFVKDKTSAKFLLDWCISNDSWNKYTSENLELDEDC